jgi:hypothetical protein
MRKTTIFIWNREDYTNIVIQKKSIKYNLLTLLALISVFWSSSSEAQSYQVTIGTPSKLKTTEISQLYEYDRVEELKFKDKIADRTAYPFIETSISLNLGWYAYQAFLSDGRMVEYSTRGEKQKYQECFGEICMILTDRNLLGISNYIPSWSKSSLHNEEIFRIKIGAKAAFVITERNIYVYNGIWNEWEKIGLESESVLGISNKNDLALIITSKRIRAIDLATNEVQEQNVSLKPILRYEIKSRVIDFFSYDRVFQYQANLNQFEEVRLDR